MPTSTSSHHSHFSPGGSNHSRRVTNEPTKTTTAPAAPALKNINTASNGATTTHPHPHTTKSLTPVGCKTNHKRPSSLYRKMKILLQKARLHLPRLGRPVPRVVVTGPSSSSLLHHHHQGETPLAGSQRTAQVQGRRRLFSTAAATTSTNKNTDENTTTNITTLEVERKFAPTAQSIHLLLTGHNGNSSDNIPPFKSLLPQGTVHFEDIYYDTPTKDLENTGIWLRLRRHFHDHGDQHPHPPAEEQSTGKWQAKVRLGGNYTNSAFQELTDEDEIVALLNSHTLSLGPDGGDGELLLLPQQDGQGGAATTSSSPSIWQVSARFVSHRDTFLVDDTFTVILDKTDFGHVVGEVELEKKVTVTVAGSKQGAAGPGSGGEVEKQDEKVDGLPVSHVIAQMDQEIDDFMRRHEWAFPPGKPVGKLSAYFALKDTSLEK